MNAQLVRELFDYNPATGKFVWKINPGGRVKAGLVAGTYDDNGYIIIRYRRVGYKAHRLAWLYVYGVMPTLQIDHRNKIRDDNRIENLREADAHINNVNITPAKSKLVAGGTL